MEDTYKVYVEDFVYTYVHQFIHRRKKEDLVLAAVLLGKTVRQGEQEYVFISGAQKVEFQMEEEVSDAGGEDGKAAAETTEAEGADSRKEPEARRGHDFFQAAGILGSGCTSGSNSILMIVRF